MALPPPAEKKQLQEAYQNESCAAVKEEDRISKLPDELIHLIFSFMKDTKFAVQTCILSTRWKNVWTTLPHLSFNWHYFGAKFKFSKFVDHIFSGRNHASQISTINITSYRVIDHPNFKNTLSYAFSHGIQHLKIINNKCNRRRPFPIPISTFNSESLKCLHLRLTYWHFFEICPSPPSLLWNLPNLTSLYLYQVQFKFSCNTTHKSADLFSNLVNLKDLSLICCRTPDIDALNIISLTLQHLTICPGYYCNKAPKTRVFVSTPNLTSFTYRGDFSVLLSATERLVSLTEATIALPYWRDEKHVESMHKLLSLLRNTMFLTLSSGAVRILAGAPELLENQASPLCNLKCLTIGEDNNPPAISNDVRTYFLNSSPNAIIYTISGSGRRTKLQNCLPEV